MVPITKQENRQLSDRDSMLAGHSRDRGTKVWGRSSKAEELHLTGAVKERLD